MPHAVNCFALNQPNQLASCAKNGTLMMATVREKNEVNLTLKPEHERIVTEELQTGHYQSAEDVMERALEALREKEHGPSRHEGKRDPRKAAARIRERRKGVKLGGLRTRDLVDEGRR